MNIDNYDVTTIGKYDLVKTCSACPEQYDVYIENKLVGYLRLRHGYFRAECPHCCENLVYEADPKGDGMFEEEERDFYLNEAIKKIDEYLRDNVTEQL